MSDEERGGGIGGGRRSRRAKSKSIDYAKEQEFSDEENLFEDVDKPAPVPTNVAPKKRRTKGNRKSKGKKQQQQQEGDYRGNDGMDQYEEEDAEDYRPPKPVYTERGYDPTLPPIRERFTFLPEYELDGSPKIEGIIGRRPVDEKEDKEDKNSDDDNSTTSDGNDDVDDEEEGSDGKKQRSRRGNGNKGGKKDSNKSSAKNKDKIIESNSNFIDYEYLVKYRNQSHLHLEWKTGADLESMNKSAKTIYRRYLKKVAAGQDEELENPDVDQSFLVVQKILAEEEQELELELSDKELLTWEKEREKELADEDETSEEEEEENKEEAEKKDEGPKETNTNNIEKKDEGLLETFIDKKDAMDVSPSEEKKGESFKLFSLQYTTLALILLFCSLTFYFFFNPVVIRN
jgi:hypothetical protein